MRPLTTDELIDYIGTHQRGTIDGEVIAALRQLQSANARAEAAEKQLEASSIYHEGTAAQIEQLQKQAVCQHYLIEPHLHAWKCSSCGCVLQDDGDWQNQYRLQQENEQLQEQLRWRKYPDEKPRKSHEFIAVKIQRYDNAYDDVMSWNDDSEDEANWNEMGVTEWLPIPPTDLVPGGVS